MYTNTFIFFHVNAVKKKKKDAKIHNAQNSILYR